MEQLTRYDNISTAVTPFDPLESATAWISSLKSQAYTSDLLRTTHGFTSGAKTNRVTKAIQMYAQNSLDFLDQAYSGPPKVAFLPLYYAVLNLSKVTMIASGLEADLQRQRWHGVSYQPFLKTSQKLLTESITLWKEGAFPLLYRALTGSGVKFTKRQITMEMIYPYVSGVTYEFGQVFLKRPARQRLTFDIEQLNNNRFRLVATAQRSTHLQAGNLKYLQAIVGFRKIPGNATKFGSKAVTANTAKEARPLLYSKVRRFLLYDFHVDGSGNYYGVDTPLSAAEIFLPEEIPIWITLYHLSNVARYNPEFLTRLENSKAWPVILALRKHAVLRYLILFWSNLHKRQFRISVH